MSKIAVAVRAGASYPDAASSFRPSQRYPEYPADWELFQKGENAVYDCVREAIALMGLDSERFGTPEWNPLADVIKPGNCVLIKPNFVNDVNHSGGGIECLYTQPSVISAVLDYVYLALKDTGRVVVGDAPMQSCDFDRLRKQSNLDSMISYYRERGMNVSLVDFRAVKATIENSVQHYEFSEARGKVIDLGAESEFSSLTEEQVMRLRKGANDPDDLHAHHNLTKHEYEVCNELLEADVVIDMPKPKLHMKAGVTISLKNMVGVNVRKEFLPHHMEGDKLSGTGDAYCKTSLIKRIRAKARDKAYVMALKGKYTHSFIHSHYHKKGVRLHYK